MGLADHWGQAMRFIDRDWRCEFNDMDRSELLQIISIANEKINQIDMGRPCNGKTSSRF